MKQEQRQIIKTTVLIGIVMLIIFFCHFGCSAQDTTYTKNGYELDWPELHVRVDTIRDSCYMRLWTRGTYLVNIKTGALTHHWNPAVKMLFGTAVTFPYRKDYVIELSRKGKTVQYKLF